MPRLATIEIASLNIKIHSDHSTEAYRDIFKFMYRNKVMAKFWGEQQGLLGTLETKNLPDINASVLYGYLYLFTNIDSWESWLNIQTIQPVKPGDEGGPPPIPEWLKPNLKEALFAFFPSVHRLFFDVTMISPNNMKRLISKMVSDRRIRRDYGIIDVEVVSRKDAIDKIKRMALMESLYIVLTRENDLLGNSEKQRILGKMEERRLVRQEVYLKSTKEVGIARDEEIDGLIDATETEGKAEAKGYDRQGARVYINTDQHPRKHLAEYEPDGTDLNKRNSFLYMTKTIVSQILNRMR